MLKDQFNLLNTLMWNDSKLSKKGYLIPFLFFNLN